MVKLDHISASKMHSTSKIDSSSNRNLLASVADRPNFVGGGNHQKDAVYSVDCGPVSKEKRVSRESVFVQSDHTHQLDESPFMTNNPQSIIHE